MKDIKIIIFLLGCILLSCRNKSTISSDKNLLEIENFEERFYRHKREGLNDLIKKLNLPDISKSVDSFELRCFASTQDRRFTFVNIRYFDKKWNYTQSYIYMSREEIPYVRDDTTNYYLQGAVDSVLTKKLVLSGKETEFIDSLKLLLTNFPKEHDLDNTLMLSSGADGFAFEVAQQDKYLYLSYPCYSDIIGKPKSHAQVRSLLNFLNKHLELNFVECN